MDVFTILDEVQTIARNGLACAENPFDRERYGRLSEVATRSYAEGSDCPRVSWRRVGYGPHAMVAVLYLCEMVGGTPALSHEVTELAYRHIDEVHPWHSNHEQFARRALAVHRGRSMMRTRCRRRTYPGLRAANG